jgi:hypothetical protein
MFLFHYRKLWCLVYCWGWFCQFALADSLFSWLVSTDYGTCSYQCFLSNFPPISLHTLKCSWTCSIISFYVLLFCQYWACW